MRSNNSEATHNARFIHHKEQEDNNLQLTEPLFLYFKKLPKNLLFLLFFDYKLFNEKNETWRDYDSREPGCIYDLFNAVARNVFTYIKPDNKNKPLITLDEIKKLHEVLSQNTGKTGVNLTPGRFRKNFTYFRLTSNTSSPAGIKEILDRIKKDNTQDGFVIGELTRLNIAEKFCYTMYILIGKKIMSGEYPKLPLGAQDDEKFRKEVFPSTIKEAIEKVYADLVEEKHYLDKEKIEKIITDFLNEYIKFEEFDLTKDARALGLLKYQFDELSRNLKYHFPKSEHELTMQTSREKTLNEISVSSDMENLSRKIYSQIENDEEICVFPPTIDFAEKRANEAIEKYNNSIQTAISVDEKIKIIDELIHELEILHLFDDVNCRTTYCLMNQLLVANGIKWSVLYDPNRLDALSSQERIDEIKKGIYRLEFIMRNSDEHIRKLNDYLQGPEIQNAYEAPEETKYENGVVTSQDYDIAASELQNVLLDLYTNYIMMIDSLIKKYERLSVQASSKKSSFFELPERNNFKIIHESLVKLKEENNFLNFFDTMKDFNDDVGLKKDIQSLENIFNYKSNSLFQQRNYSDPISKI